MLIRKTKKKDIKQLAALFDQYRIFYKQEPDIKGATVFIKKRMKKEESVVFVATEEKKLIGFTQLYPVYSSVGMCRIWLLNDLYVDKDSRSKGVATALLEKAAEFGKETKAKRLFLQTATDNSAAQKLYEKPGWKKESDFFYRLDL